jgi:hypothetical protein
VGFLVGVALVIGVVGGGVAAVLLVPSDDDQAPGRE